MKAPRLNTAIQISEILWPEFVTIKGCVFLKRDKVSKDVDVSYPVQTESDASHIHIMDLFEHSAETAREPFLKTSHPDFKTGCELGRKICHMWALKLMYDFPKDNFRVYLHGFDPIVRFHKIRKGNPNWTEPKYFRQYAGKGIAKGEVLMLDTRQLKRAQQNAAANAARRRR